MDTVEPAHDPVPAPERPCRCCGERPDPAGTIWHIPGCWGANFGRPPAIKPRPKRPSPPRQRRPRAVPGVVLTADGDVLAAPDPRARDRVNGAGSGLRWW